MDDHNGAPGRASGDNGDSERVEEILAAYIDRLTAGDRIVPSTARKADADPPVERPLS